MKSRGTKFVSMLLVSSMILTSGLGFAPRTAKAIDDSSVYSYSFDYIDTVTEKGNKLIVFKTDENLTGYDTTLFSVDGGAEIGTVDLDAAKDEIRIQIDGIDPEVLNYKLTIKAGGLTFSGYQQLDDIVVDFKSYEITPGFKSIFKDESTTNNVFDNNTPEEIKIFVDSDYVSSVSAKTLSGEVNWTEFEVGGTDEVHSVSYEVLNISGDATRKVDTKNADGKFPAIYAGVSSTKDVIITAYDSQGRELDSATVRYNFGSQFGTNFDASNVKTFNSDGYTVRELLDGTTKLDDLLAGKSYADLGKIKVFYANVDNIITVNTANELAAVMAKLGTGNELSGKSVKIKLGADITLGSTAILSHDASLMIEGNDNTITGNLTLGNGTNKTVKLSNATVNGNLGIDAGVTGNAYLTNVTVGNGFAINVISGGYSSVTLVGTTAETMNIDNDTAKTHVVAGAGTVVQTTNVMGTFDVKMTSIDGGLFNVIDLENSKELYLIGSANSPFKTVNVVSGITPNGIIKLAANTTVENLNVNSKVVMTGKASSVVTTATVDPSLAAGSVVYDGFVIGNASGDKFAGTNVPGDSSSGNELVVPTTADNKIVLGGTIYGTEVSDIAVNAGGKTLTMTLEAAASDRPLNIEWDNSNTAAFKTAIAALISEATGTVLNQEANFDVTVDSDKKVATITWNATTNLAINDKLVVTISETALQAQGAALFASKIDTSKLPTATFDADVAAGSSIYRPTFHVTSDSVTLNKFSVYKNSNTAIDSVMITANKDLSDVDLIGSNATMEYRTSQSDWISGATTDVSTAVANLSSQTESIISFKSTGSNDSQDKFILKKNEVWFQSGSSAADIAAAINDTDVTRVYLAASAGAYDLSGQTITDRVGNDVELRVYPVGADTTASVNLGTIEDVGDLDIGSNLTVTDTLAPTITNVSGTTIENAGDTIAITFSEAMNEASVEDLANWAFDLDADGAGASDGATMDETDATIVYDDATKTATVTLKDAAASALLNTNYVAVTPTADVKDAGNTAMATTQVYGTTAQVAITGDVVAPTATITADKSVVKNGTTVTFTAVFSEELVGTPGFTLTDGTAASITDSGDKKTWTFTANDIDADIAVTATLTTAKDTAGNVVVAAGVATGVTGDNTAPTTTVTNASTYTAATKTLVLTTTDLDTAGTVGTDIKTQLDWTKVKLDADTDDANDLTFQASYVDSATVTSATELTIVLSDAGKVAFEGTTGYGGADDDIEVTAGFVVDIAGNVSTTDAQAASSLTIN